MLDVSIEKFTLESLTTGMYSDARIVFREYIQNAVDALEEAISKKIIESSWKCSAIIRTVHPRR